jgi:hypothetical protein
MHHKIKFCSFWIYRSFDFTIICKFIWVIILFWGYLKGQFLRPGRVVHTYNPNYLGDESRKVLVMAGPGKNLETLSEKNKK